MPEFGICIWSVVPVRTNPSDKEELCTQLLFGDSYQVLKQEGDWLEIRTDFDHYEGWIDVKQHHLINTDFHEDLIALNNQPVVISDLSKAVFAEKAIPLLRGSRLPFFKENRFKIGQDDWGFVGEAGTASENAIVEKAFEFLGAPYLWGGKTQYGIDCSGFVQIVFRQCGVELPRDAYQQAEVGERVRLEEAQKGDLAFFKNKEGKIIHVGVVLKDGTIIHAHGEVRIDNLDEKGIYNGDRKLYSHQLAHINHL